MTGPIEVGDVVYVEGASAILGDVRQVDEAEELAVVEWRPTTTTESFDDLIVGD